MRFFYLLSPANWLKIALFSLVLACAASLYLAGYRITITRVVPPRAPPEASASAPLATIVPQATQLLAPPNIAQTRSVAPAGILDQFTEFAILKDFDDTPVKPNYTLPASVAPVGLLDPLWTGVAP